MKRFSLLATPLLFALALPVVAQDVCDLHDDQILTDAVEVVLRLPADWEEPAAPDPAALLNMAPVGETEQVECSRGGMVGALNCVTEQIESAGGDVAGPPTEAEAEAEVRADSPPRPSFEEDPGAWLEARISMRAKIDSRTIPAGVRFVPIGMQIQGDHERMTHDAAQRLRQVLNTASTTLQRVTTTLAHEDLTELTEGGDFSSLFFEAAVSDLNGRGVAAFTRGAIELPEPCRFLLSLRTASTAANTEMASLQGRIVRLRDALERTTDDDQKRMIEAEIARLTAERAAKAGPADLLAQRLEAEETRQEEARHAIEVAAIKDNPQLLEASEVARLGRAAERMREFRRYEATRAAAMQAYRDGLADFDEQIANAPDDATRDILIEQRERYERLAQEFADRTRSLMTGRHRDAAREFERNAADGIGPTSYADVHARLSERGFDANAYIELSDEDLVRRASRIARSDQYTQGGAAGRDNGALQFMADTGEAFLEERNRLAFTPDGAVRAIYDIATGERTFGQVVDDQFTFFNRYGHYWVGVGEGGVSGVAGLVELGWDGVNLLAETEQYYANAVISGLGGPDDAINLVETDRTDGLSELFARGFAAVDQAEEARRRVGLPRRTSVADAWRDPSLMGDMFYDLADGMGDGLSAGADMLGTAGGNQLTVLSSQGERGILTATRGTGRVVGETADVGMAALSSARAVRRFLRGADAAVPDEAIRALDGPVDEVAGAAARADAPAGPATAPFEGQLRPDGPTILPDEVNNVRLTGAEDYVPDPSLARQPVFATQGEVDLVRQGMRDAQADAFGRQLYEFDDVGELPGNLTEAAPSSPFNADYRATDVALRPSVAEARTAGGATVRLDRRSAAGTEIAVDGDVIQLGEHVGSGASTSVYRAADGNGVWRVTDGGNADEVRAMGEELVGRNLLREAEARGARYFRPAARSGAPRRVQTDGSAPVFLTREEQVDSVASVYGATGERLEPIDRLTLALAQREMNTHGIAYTDMKLSNVGLVDDVASPTGRRVVYFDTGNIFPMRGATAVDRAENARHLQQITDLPMPRGTSGAERDFWPQSAFGAGRIDDVLDTRPFGGRVQGYGSTPEGNRGRAEYLRLMAMSDDELANAIRTSESLRGSAARRGVDLSRVQVPTAR
ncbi:hypothetical protein [Pontivivens insulae]|uniref:Uncharacterized protein n=1 Tax=Pontivivens insulae TaxID=1639689 RepID=A0A2R8A7F5_9RHOB|nr:hypothetical protein [Pontivivens insulae]RED18234.1 hypothetical protein DFR53_0429 [Pontivivens insulae]SPF28132.1 hypothetical protein POI8812_00430 [Pontivivens insulae]